MNEKALRRDARAIADQLVRPTGIPHDPEAWVDPRIERPASFAPAAVLIAITDRADPGLLLTRRSARLRRHAGQISFPGGRVDDTDDSIIAAALREAWEELALPTELVQVSGELEPYHTFSGYAITPVIGVVPPDLPLVANPAEVDDWFELPLSVAFDPARLTWQTTQWNGRTHAYRELIWEDHRIWGITASILALLAERMTLNSADL